jgi:Fungal Zn(2)-Cys(6) binuclear cluster domain
MSSAEPEQTKPTARVLACALCKQRRVKCSRSFPCTNCIRAGVQCVQPTVHKRRRRFAERGLLDRLHYYEDLLRQNNIPFEPLYGSIPIAVTPRDDDDAYPARRNEDKEAMYVYDCISAGRSRRARASS